ncbi:hypothetical protein [Paenibacillus bouchesdurhonensis]|uniref:hypothetical protein n=1 Tax=Paenibacillus bouchesdurhonensis TaxID=1870990 RepID=UPI000DA63A15|nr:hypothetical protein [Paenibacillus bouchesdurhonensis]
MDKETIHVGLYGGKGLFGGKEKPLEASVIHCDKHSKCSYYNNNQCLRVRSFGGMGCKFGRNTTHTGYTSRARKYGEFKAQWQGHECYGKLNYPPRKLGLVNGYVVFPYPHIKISEEEGYEVESPFLFASDGAFIQERYFTVELIRKICLFRPQAVFGGEITDYQKKIVPLFLSHLKEVMPEKYQEYIQTYPSEEQSISYVGRRAKLKTVAPSKVNYESSQYPQFNEAWNWDGERLIYESGNLSGFKVIKDYTIETLSIIPGDQSIITITSNDQVTDKTVFVD